MKKLLFLALFAISAISVQAQQFGDFEIVCWDSAGVVTPLQVRVSSRNTDGKLIYTFYRLNYAPGVLDTKKVVPTVGTVGACGNSQLQSIIVNLQNTLVDNDTIIVRLDSLLSGLDSLLGLTEQPQICDCLYSIFLENSTATIGVNASQPVWNFQRVVTRNCGAGPEEIFRQGGVQLGNKLFHSTSAVSLVSGSGVLDSMELHVKNPIDSFVVYLSPAQVALKYPSLLSVIDTAHLRYNTATTSQMDAALTTVFQNAIVKYAIAKGIATPLYELAITVSGAGAVTITFNVVNAPTGPYVNFRNNLYFLKYHRTGAGATITNTSVGFNNSLGFDASSYATPCGLNATVTNQAILVDISTTANNWDAITVVGTVTPSQLSQTNRTCTQTCPTTGDCVEICNDESNPVPVIIISDPTDCPVLGVVEFPLVLTSSSSSLAGGTYHSVSVSVTSGTVVISAINDTGTTTASFTTGQTFSVIAKECTYLPTAFTINATAGAATVASTR